MPENLLEFKFDTCDFYDLSSIFTRGFIKSADGGYLVPDSEKKIGLNEL